MGHCRSTTIEDFVEDEPFTLNSSLIWFLSILVVESVDRYDTSNTLEASISLNELSSTSSRHSRSTLKAEPLVIFQLKNDFPLIRIFPGIQTSHKEREKGGRSGEVFPVMFPEQ